MKTAEMMIPFCWTFIGGLFLLVIVPYVRKRSDLLTSWNLFLLGSINFVGAAGLKASYSSDEFRIFDYTSRDYLYFMLGVLTFYGTIILSYYRIKVPRKMAGRFLRKWPPMNVSVLFFMLPLSLLLAVLSVFPPPVPGLSQIATQVGNKAVVFSLVLAFVAWFRQRSNPLLLTTLGVVTLLVLVLAIQAGGGRRTILGVMMAIPICAYWLGLRYRSPLRTLVLAGAFGVLTLLVIGAYSQVRHFDRRGSQQERNMVHSFEALTEIPSRLLHPDVDPLLGQNAAQTSLASIHLYTGSGRAKPAPFHALIFVLVSPVPRLFWPDKPVGLGYSLPKDCHVKGTNATWGPGIVGHGFHEGGLHMLVFYGIVWGMVLRYLDELLARQSDNPYLLGSYSAMSGHIIGWPRGDIGTFTLQIIACFLAGILLGLLGRMIFGTGTIYPRTDHLQFSRRGDFQVTV
jgi:hypothetical protein